MARTHSTTRGFILFTLLGSVVFVSLHGCQRQAPPSSTAAPVTSETPTPSAPDVPLEPVDELEQDRSTLAAVAARHQDMAVLLQTQPGQLEQITAVIMDRHQLQSIRDRYAHAQNKDPKTVGQQAAKLLPKLEEQAREIYVAAIETQFAKSQLDIQITLAGQKNDQLRLSSLRMDQSLVDRLQNEFKIRDQAKFFGFKKLSYSSPGTHPANPSWTESF